jgi:hypothetical protein
VQISPGLTRVDSRFVAADGNHVKSLRAILLIEFVKERKLRTTGPSPMSPEKH